MGATAYVERSGEHEGQPQDKIGMEEPEFLFIAYCNFSGFYRRRVILALAAAEVRARGGERWSGRQRGVGGGGSYRRRGRQRLGWWSRLRG